MKTEREQDDLRERLEAALAQQAAPINRNDAKSYEINRNDARSYENITPETVEAFAAVRLAMKSLVADAIASSRTGEIAEPRTAGNIIEDDWADEIASIMENLEKGIASESKAMDHLIRRMAAV